MAKHPFEHKPRRRLWGPVNQHRAMDWRPEPGLTPQRSIGECTGCGQWCFERDCQPAVQHDGTRRYACGTCGSLVDEQAVPF